MLATQDGGSVYWLVGWLIGWLERAAKRAKQRGEDPVAGGQGGAQVRCWRAAVLLSQPARPGLMSLLLPPRYRSGFWLPPCIAVMPRHGSLETPPTHAPLGLPACPATGDEALARELDAELNAGRRGRHRPAYYGEQRGGGAGGGEEDEDEWGDDGEVGCGSGRMRSGRLDARICD